MKNSYNAEGHPAYRGIGLPKADEAVRRRACAGQRHSVCRTVLRGKNGGYDIIELTERINGRPLPQIEVADMTAELAAGNKSIFSRLLFDALKQTIDEGNQAILF